MDRLSLTNSSSLLLPHLASLRREWAIEKIDRATDKAKAFNQVCDILLVVEKEKEKKRQQVGRGRAGRRHDFVERSDEVMRATVRRRVQKWLKQAGIRLR